MGATIDGADEEDGSNQGDESDNTHESNFEGSSWRAASADSDTVPDGRVHPPARLRRSGQQSQQ
jgi:hypothetical protein